MLLITELSLCLNLNSTETPLQIRLSLFLGSGISLTRVVFFFLNVLFVLAWP